MKLLALYPGKEEIVVVKQDIASVTFRLGPRIQKACMVLADGVIRIMPLAWVISFENTTNTYTNREVDISELSGWDLNYVQSTNLKCIRLFDAFGVRVADALSERPDLWMEAVSTYPEEVLITTGKPVELKAHLAKLNASIASNDVQMGNSIDAVVVAISKPAELV